MARVGVSQKAVIFNKAGKFLVLLRGRAAPSNPLKWDLPGGDLDFGEDPRKSMVGEIKEESGLEVSKLTPFDVEAHINPKGHHWVTIAYRAEAKDDNVQISWEHEEYRWVDNNDFFKLPSIPKIVRFIKKLQP